MGGTLGLVSAPYVEKALGQILSQVTRGFRDLKIALKRGSDPSRPLYTFVVDPVRLAEG